MYYSAELLSELWPCFRSDYDLSAIESLPESQRKDIAVELERVSESVPPELTQRLNEILTRLGK